jgi:hypothetical protein
MAHLVVTTMGSWGDLFPRRRHTPSSLRRALEGADLLVASGGAGGADRGRARRRAAGDVQPLSGADPERPHAAGPDARAAAAPDAPDDCCAGRPTHTRPASRGRASRT